MLHMIVSLPISSAITFFLILYIHHSNHNYISYKIKLHIHISPQAPHFKGYCTKKKNLISTSCINNDYITKNIARHTWVDNAIAYEMYQRVKHI